MAIKLKSALKTLQRKLASNRNWFLKGAVFALVLGFAASENFSFLPALLFLAVATGLYAEPVFQTMPYLLPYLFLIGLSFLSFKLFGSADINPALIIFFGFLFFMLVGLKNMAFVARHKWYLAFQLILFYLTAAVFFAIDKSQGLLIPSLGWLITSYVLLLHYFRFQEIKKSKAIKLSAMIIALVSLELAWVLGLLAIGFLSASGILAAYIFVLEELASHYLSRTLTAKLGRAYSFGFLALLLLTFLLS